MNKGNKVKADALGVSYGAACNQLRKRLLFKFVCEAKLNMCHRCGKEIISVGDFSVEHITAWLQADNPVDAFFDLDNIAYSHLSCNSGAASRTNKLQGSREEYRKKFNRYQREYRHRMTPEERRAKRREKYLRLGT